MKKLVIFDLDGTLLNSIADLAAASNYTLSQLGFPLHEEKEYLRFVGNGIAKLLERALPPQERTEQTLSRAKAIFLPYYQAHSAELTRPYEGIPALLQELSRRGILLAVATNKYQPAAQKLVNYYFPDISFAAVAGQRDGLPVKPDPFFVREILTSCHISNADTLYVGDSDVDMQTAQNAGLCACAVTWGFRTRAELAAYRPAFIVDKPKDILDIL